MFQLKPAFTAGAVHNGIIYFSDSFINALYAADITNGNCRYLGVFPGEQTETRLLHSRAFVYGQSIIVFAPGKGKHIHLYDVTTGELDRIELDCGNDSSFSSAVLSGNELWLLPSDVEHPVISCNIATGMIESYDLFEGVRRSDINSAIGIRYTCQGDKVFAAIICTSVMVEFDLEKKTSAVYDLPFAKIYQIYFSDKERWMCTDNEIYRCRSGEDGYTRMDTDDPISTPVLFLDEPQGDVYAVSAIGGSVYVLREDSFAKISDIRLERCPTYTPGYTYGGFIVEKEGILICPPYGKDAMSISKGKIRWLPFHVENSEDLVMDEKKAFFPEDDNMLYEGGPVRIADYIPLFCRCHET